MIDPTTATSKHDIYLAACVRFEQKIDRHLKETGISGKWPEYIITEDENEAYGGKFVLDMVEKYRKNGWKVTLWCGNPDNGINISPAHLNIPHQTSVGCAAE